MAKCQFHSDFSTFTPKARSIATRTSTSFSRMYRLTSATLASTRC